jgi:uncharacterized protein YndB with AHSA1/START domain
VVAHVREQKPNLSIERIGSQLRWWRPSVLRTSAAAQREREAVHPDVGMPRMASTSTRTRRHVNAPRATVYRALLDARAVAIWMVLMGMTSHVHAFDAREGGLFRISLTYDEPTGTGKTTAHTDTYHGQFVKRVPNEQVIEVMAFETADAAMGGEMLVTFTLTDAGGGTDVLAVHDNVPPGVSPADNATGWRMALDKLAAFVEAGQHR